MGVSFVLDVGAQLHRLVAVYGRLEGTTALAYNQASLAAVLELRADPIMTLGVGAGYDVMAEIEDLGCPGVGTCQTYSWGGVSVPFIVGFLFPQLQEARRERVVRLDFEWAPGVTPTSGQFAWHGGLRLGVGWM